LSWEMNLRSTGALRRAANARHLKSNAVASWSCGGGDAQLLTTVLTQTVISITVCFG
jgi:hypothetical protein